MTDDVLSPTLRTAQDEWMLARAVAKPSGNTILAYKADLASIAGLLREVTGGTGDALDAVRVSDLTVKNLRHAFSKFAADHSKASIARAQSTWRGFCSFCVAEDWLPGDPMSGVEKVRAPKRQPKPLRGEAETATALLEFLKTVGREGRNPWRERDLAVISLLLLTGLRSSEARSLKTGDIFGPGGERRIRVIGKGDKERTIPIEDQLVAIIDAYTESRKTRFPDWKPAEKDVLFVNDKNTALTTSQLRYIVDQSLRAANLGGTVQEGAMIHGLRHTFATILADNGATAAEIMELMGHATLNTSQGYITASAREVRRSAAANPIYRALGSN